MVRIHPQGAKQIGTGSPSGACPATDGGARRAEEADGETCDELPILGMRTYHATQSKGAPPDERGMLIGGCPARKRAGWAPPRSRSESDGGGFLARCRRSLALAIKIVVSPATLSLIHAEKPHLVGRNRLIYSFTIKMSQTAYQSKRMALEGLSERSADSSIFASILRNDRRALLLTAEAPLGRGENPLTRAEPRWGLVIVCWFLKNYPFWLEFV